MTAYMFRLCASLLPVSSRDGCAASARRLTSSARWLVDLEYARLWADEPSSMDFVLDEPEREGAKRMTKRRE